MENRKYLIILKSETNLVDFQLIISDPDFLPTSNDGTKIIIKWEDIPDPDFIKTLSWSEGPYSNDEINQIVYLPEWVISE